MQFLYLELMLSMLFNKNKGLLSFLNNELKRFNSQKGFDVAIKETFYLLQFIIEQFSDIFIPYIIETKVFYNLYSYIYN